ncbi:hypothetical protein AB0F81_27630 [Actinoplanes sp. NPDC024001]|uniref:hypothetical protein n=1 Tax=Actinoplanes sp. NPDC024001 TaxID=3154598 RepID=UPI0033ED103A
MINYRAGAAVLAMLSTAACAAPGTTPATVPSGCAATEVRWSAPVKEPRLTHVTLKQGDGDLTGRVVMDEPFAPSITGVTAPADWTAMLATSLSDETGIKVETGPAVLPDGDIGFPMAVADDPSIPQPLFYEGVTSVSAEFTVSCATPVTGAFTSWTTIEFGGLACGHSAPPEDALGRLARPHCPATPAPRPSGYVDAVPFDEPTPS